MEYTAEQTDGRQVGWSVKLQQVESDSYFERNDDCYVFIGDKTTSDSKQDQ